MKKNFFTKNYNLIIKFLSIPILLGLVIYYAPNNYKPYYNFDIGKTWNYPNLKAPFDFPIKKTNKLLENDIAQIKSNSYSYYKFDSAITINALNQLNNIILTNNLGLDSLELISLNSIFYNILNKGIIKPESILINKDDSISLENIKYIKGDYIAYAIASDFYTLNEAQNTFKEKLLNSKINNPINIYESTSNLLTENVLLDYKKTTDEYLYKINNLSNYHGIVQKGELIISNGEMVDKDKLNILTSLNEAYAYNISYSKWSKISEFILTLLTILTFMVFLLVYEPKSIKSNKSFLLIFGSIFIIVIIFSLCPPDYIYMVPILIYPIVLRSFYNDKIAICGLFCTTLAAAFHTPQPFEFTIITIITGTIIVSRLKKLERRSQYFYNSIITFILYSLIFFLFEVVRSGEIQHIRLLYIFSFIINSLLLILTFPMTFFIEKIFGYTTDISLIELANTNNKLLRKLSDQAPGTFHHSIQVANLAESAAKKIGANVLLTRVGALYHDIGKLQEPYFFTENQVKNFNPHEELLPDQSAKILNAHVINGLEIASKYHLPEVIKDFIRTHHGTKDISFFYRSAIEQYGLENVNKNDYKYKGPTPFNKETAIVMMADSIEAASNSLKEADEQHLTYLVNNIIEKQISDQQFSNATITLKEIEEVKKVFIDKLKSMFHFRIKYPE
ncbi:MAG: HD family phosphohydrolase [Bacteroidales bacterium]